jgi:photosystem II stability/assembly factor-like uncharacterized protein
MKKIHLLTVFVLLTIFLCVQAYSQENTKWKSIGPNGGSIQALAVNPQNLKECFAIGNSSGGYIFRSTNGGKDWTNLHEFPEDIYDIAVDPINPDILYLLSDGYLLKSTDKGKTWTDMPFSQSAVTRNSQLAINPRHPSALFVIGKDPSYYKKACFLQSSNGAKTWTSHTFFTAPSTIESYSLAISPSSPNVLYATIGWRDHYGSVVGCVFKSSDSGQSWHESSDTLHHKINTITVDPLDPNKVYVGTNFTVFRSTDGGQDWHQSDGIVYSSALLIDPINTNILYAGHDNCSYKSEDGGIHWSRYRCENLGSCTDLLPLGNKILFASNNGIFASSNGGEDWEDSHEGISRICLKTVSVTDTTPITIFALPYNGEKLYISDDFGITWKFGKGLESCGSLSWVEAFPDNPEHIFISALGGG